MNPEENERDEFNFDDDLALPPGIKINDPVRMYLKEIGRVPFSLRKKKLGWPSVSKMGMKRRSVD